MGRYDTPNHQIFGTFETVHKYDFHNPNFTGAAVGCPREPWHDLHCKIDGHRLQKMKTSYDDSLLRLERIPDVLGIEEAAREREGDLDGWHVQVLHSIDSNSVNGFPKDPKEAPSRNLVCGKNILIDMSIHTAYVKAIRVAQHFIYIENQYFLGSSYNWANYKDLGANNLLPMEIALKIVSKIRVRERFSVYIVFGLREFQPVLLHKDFSSGSTMQMMYETIYKALEEVGLEKEYEPSDYLNFFCLGNREAEGTGSKPDSRSFTGNTPQSGPRKNRHFLIYVLSKGMIVYDEFVILGSANINQRSLEGTRDTEIAMGAYQPHYTWEGKHANPHGQIYRYRMSLWVEHTGILEQCFEQPESLECVRRVRWMGELNWKQFAADEITEMRGHLLKFHVEVDRTGKVRPLPGCETFPDMGGKIIGTFTGIQENLTI
ncbi:Phospholipase D beta 1 [Orobanche minor]